MECPSCLMRLERHRSSHGYIWACAGCRGRSLTLPVLRNAGVRTEFINALWQQDRSAAPVGTRLCPHCGRSMSHARLEMLVDTLDLDVCCTCKAIWFDAGEFEAVPQRPVVKPAKGMPGVSSEARQRLAILEVQQAARREQTDPTAGEFGPEETWQWIPALMGLPIEIDGPAVGQKPWLTWSLIAACMLTTFAALRGGGWNNNPVISEWGFIPADWERHGLLTLFTSFFLHAGVLHLLGNMWALWVFGDNVEDRLGRLPYLLMLTAGHLAGMILHAGFDPRSHVPCVGASAGISSVIAFYAISFPNVRLGILVWFRWIRIPMVWAVVIYAVVQAVGTIGQVGGLSSVSYLGHVGGMAVGLCTAAIYRMQRDSPKRPRSGEARLPGTG